LGFRAGVSASDELGKGGASDRSLLSATTSQLNGYQEQAAPEEIRTNFARFCEMVLEPPPESYS
jgi:hypothetical protein